MQIVCEGIVKRCLKKKNKIQNYTTSIFICRQNKKLNDASKNVSCRVSNGIIFPLTSKFSLIFFYFLKFPKKRKECKQSSDLPH